MIKLTPSTVRLAAQARDKTEAIRIAGSLLVDSGNMQSGYIDSMLLREKVANTYLGNGIAIPHGLPKDRDLIVQTADFVRTKPYFMSDELSLVDVSIAPVLWRLPAWQIELPKEAQPLMRYANQLFSRPAFRLSLSDQERELRLG